MGALADIYELLCHDLCEPGGVQLGLVTSSQLLQFANEAIMEMLREGGIVSIIHTQQIEHGVQGYPVPSLIMRVDDVYAAGVLLDRSSARDTDNTRPGWRVDLGIPRSWSQDQGSTDEVRLAPAPNYNGDPFIYQWNDWAVTVDGVVELPHVHRGLTMVGLGKPDLVTAWTDAIPLLPEEIALAYLEFGILERVFRSDNEMRDDQKALYCRAQFEEGIALLKSITGESDE
jgi:hypothetical protein